MKKLKFWLMAMLAIVATASLTACSDDDDGPKDEEQTVVGKWQCNYDAYGEPWDDPLFYLFDEDGTGYEWFSEVPFSSRLEFTYTYTSSRLTVSYEGDIKPDNIYDLRYELSSNGKTLIIYGLDDDDLSELHFTRVN